MSIRVMLEIGCNHQGDPVLAAQMVREAAVLGVYGVKLQVRDVEQIPEELRDEPRDPSTSFGDTYYAHRAALELSDSAVAMLKSETERLGLVFAVSAFDMVSLRKAVEDLKVRYVKLPSQYFLREDMCAYLEAKRRDLGLFTIRSTGMHTMLEVLEHLRDFEFDVTMYCRSIYPHDEKEADLGLARVLYARLRERERGYSSHDKDGALINTMVVLGATWVERHFTLDKRLKGSDHHTVSSDPEDMRSLLTRLRSLEQILLTENVWSLTSPKERAAAEFYRRSS